MTKFHDFVQEAVIKTIPKKKKCKKANWLSQEALQIAEKKKRSERQRRTEGYTLLKAEFQRIARRDLKKKKKQKKTILPQGSMQRNRGKQ